MSAPSSGAAARLGRLRSADAGGAILVLPYDHGLEHGPVDFLDQEWGSRPRSILELASRSAIAAVAAHLGLIGRYVRGTERGLGLIAKLNGRTNIPEAPAPFSPLTGSVEEAVRAGADAIGYTLYVGSAAQERDLRQLADVRRECERLGMPLVVWSYPRGRFVDAVGGRDSLYAVDYAGRVALEMGADVIKLNLPRRHDPELGSPPPAYLELESDRSLMARRVLEPCGEAAVIFSGGSRRDDEGFLGDVRLALSAGAAGMIAGRNVFQRPVEEAERLIAEMAAIARRAAGAGAAGP